MTGVRAALRLGVILTGIGVAMLLFGEWIQVLLLGALLIFVVWSVRGSRRESARPDGCARLLTIAGGILLALLALTPLLGMGR